MATALQRLCVQARQCRINQFSKSTSLLLQHSTAWRRLSQSRTTFSSDTPTPSPSAAAALSAAEAAEVEQIIDNIDFEELYSNMNLPTPEAWVSSFPGGHRVGLMQLHPTVFAQDISRTDLLHRSVVWQRSQWRKGNAKVKGRAEVRGGGRKPHPQKGTGRARASTIRAPNWRGGGVVHGPVPKDWSQKLPRKVRHKALLTALSTRYQQGDLEVVDDVYMPSRKTKEFVRVQQVHGWTSALLVYGTSSESINFKWATRNVPKIQALHMDSLKVYTILKYQKLVLTMGAIRELEQRYGDIPVSLETTMLNDDDSTVEDVVEERIA